MSVDSTSIKTYYDPSVQKTFDSERAYVLYVIRNTYKPSCKDIVRITKLEVNAVSGRINELVKKGKIYKAGIKEDPFSHREVNYYKAFQEVEE